MLIIGLVVIVVAVLVIFMVRRNADKSVVKVTTEEKGVKADEVGPLTDESGFDDTSSSFYDPPVQPAPINDLVLGKEEMAAAHYLTHDKAVIERLKNKLIKLAMPSVSANFRLYGKLGQGRVYFFNHEGLCVGEIKNNSENRIECNISGEVTSIKANKSKSYHFVLNNFKIYLNNSRIGELHGLHDIQFIRIDDKEIKEIQLLEIDPDVSLLDIADQSIL